ncbi:MAG TPA: TlpA family protein disulfide reductase [Sphingobacteriaceae bacterium]|nr:TlpA family protein disulfide reductase [Sphingobacteriaceae bacterium]
MLKKTIHGILVAFALLTIISSCTNADLNNGTWRGILKTGSGAEIPFNFALSDSAGRKLIYIINGDERFKVDEVERTDDSLIIKIPLFDSEIRSAIKNGKLKGQWIKRLANKDEIMDFAAEQESWRFFDIPVKPKYNISGRWSSTFTNAAGKITFLVGEFKQDGTRLTGTFLSSTGDYRFLEGSVADNRLFLSCFNGTDALLFTGTLENDSTITGGKYYSGLSVSKNWVAKKDEKAILPDAYSLTTLKPEYKTIDFNFPDLSGKKVSLADEKFKNKVLIVQFLGSWCANCMDETAYLTSFYEKYKSLGVEVVGLAYERTSDFEKSQKAVSNLKKRFNINYDLLITGYTNDVNEVMKSMPMLDKFMAFPIAIVLDKKGNVRKIHTGFSGPGTGDHYTQFINEFERLINDLLKEN